MNTSNEIAFQYKHPLAEGITAMFQDLIDYRDSYVGDDVARDVTKRFASKTFPGIKAVVKKYLNVDIAELEVFPYYAYGNAYICTLVGDSDNGWMRTVDTFMTASGNTDWNEVRDQAYEYYEVTPLTAEEVLKLFNSFDPTICKITAKLPKNLVIKAKMGFDLIGHILVKECVSDKMAPYQYTARECTATILHELGHLVTSIQLIRNMFYIAEMKNEIVTNFINKAPQEEVDKFVTELLKSDEKNSKMVNDLRNRLSASYPTILFVIEKVFGLTFAPMQILINTIVGSIIGDIVAAIAESVALSPYKSSDTKNADISRPGNMLKYVEQVADQFVANHGYAADFVSSMNKFENARSVMHYGYMVGYNNSGLMWNWCKLSNMISALIYGDTSVGDSHDSYYARIRKLMQETLKVFKSNKLPPEVLNSYIKDYESSKFNYNKVPLATKLELVRTKIRGFMQYVLATPFALLGGARFNREMQKFIDDVEKLRNNELYYLKAKLQSILNKK